MKRLIIAFTLCLLFIGSSYGQFTKLGGGLFYDHKYYFNNETGDNHKLGNPAIFVTGIYEINLPFHISTRISMFMPNITKTPNLTQPDSFEKIVITGYSLDVDAHYVFNSLDRVELYGLAGMNILYTHNKYVFESIDFNETFKTKNTDLGLNLGVGSYYKMKEQFDLFGEVKVILASQIQVVASVGILLNVGWFAQNSDPGL